MVGAAAAVSVLALWATCGVCWGAAAGDVADADAVSLLDKLKLGMLGTYRLQTLSLTPVETGEDEATLATVARLSSAII